MNSLANEDHYNGGYTVIQYGSGAGGTVDAIQLEFGLAHRNAAAIPDTAEKVANAIVAFSKRYLPTVEKKAGDKIAVGVYLDKGAGPSANDLLRVLGTIENVSITKLTAEQMRTGSLAGLDILMHPGGSGGEQGRNLDEAGREQVRNFVNQGGGYVGICAGAYLATAHYSWSLNLLDAKVVDTAHWKRGKGSVDIELTTAGRQLLNTPNPKLPILYANGPLLAPAGRADIPDYEEIAAFKTELAENGAPSGVMAGTTAIARGTYGQGRVLCFSPHPEMTTGIETFVKDAVNYVKRQPAGK